jgi:ketosteroid isomerase-like protein
MSRSLSAALLAVAARGLMVRLMLAKLRHDVEALNRGDYRPVLANFAPDAVLHFPEGDHRWAGEHRGKAEIERFLRNFVAAGLCGRINELAVSGPPWRMTVVARFDDWASDADGNVIYRNRTALFARSRWGRIVEQHDFFADTERIGTMEAVLRERGVAPAELP